MSAIPQSVLAAYLETDYCVAGVPPFVLRIGTASAPLLKLYREHGTNCAAFVTACNPCSRAIGEAANAQKQAALQRELQQRGLTFFAGAGKHPNGAWPAEPSFLVMGLPLDAASTLGRYYEQNAVVCCGADAVPQLVLLR